MVFDAFVGPSATSQSVNADCERSVNLYVETIDQGAGKVRNVLYGTPGIHLFTTLPQSPVRGLFARDGRLFAVAGTLLYEVFANGSWQSRGNVGSDGLPVQIFPNGTQLMIVSYGRVYVDDSQGSGPVAPAFPTFTGVVTTAGTVVTWVSGDSFDQMFAGQVMTINGGNYIVQSVVNSGRLFLLTSAGAQTEVNYTASLQIPASSGAFLDGYGIVSIPNSRQINISALNDFTSWAGLDFALKEGYPDNLVAILADHEELWLFGSETTEVWSNTGAAGFPLERIAGAFIHKGCVAKDSPARLAGGVAWLGGDTQGRVTAYRAQGFTPQRISTHAVETAWSRYSTVADATKYTYVDRGHEFWVLSFPAAGATWAFDATTGQWHERAYLNGSTLERQRQTCHAFAFGRHLVGDYATGAIYEMSSEFYDDAGSDRYYERTAPHLSTEQLWNFFSRFQLDMEMGQSATVPAVKLSWSDDGGHTWSTPRSATPTTATYAGRMLWRRLGKSRDRVFRVTITGQSKCALLRAILDAEQGSN